MAEPTVLNFIATAATILLLPLAVEMMRRLRAPRLTVRAFARRRFAR